MTETKVMYKNCLHKKVIRTLEYAKEAANKCAKKFNKQFFVYYCPICLNYHLTTHKLDKFNYAYESRAV